MDPRSPSEDALEAARDLLEAGERIVVLTGAGISTDSGIPDFRGPQGIWTKNPEAEKASDIRYYVADAELRRRSWARRASGELWAEVEPNAGHRALVRLQDRGALHLLITQNVDELHQQAGIDPELVVEIHGTTRKVRCLTCADTAPMDVALERVRLGEPDPACRRCGGILKSATISFGQSLIAEDLDRAFRAASEADVFIAVGTSLQVYPIADAVPTAARAGAQVVIVNAEPTPYDALAAVVLNGSISDVLPRIVPDPVSDS